ncbi:M56 family metallopeptidase [Brevibacillus sp. B_LB10_24]|uniref:M56 family metallopeptidase n=1 Tax=Brevibacillus sp. B_LB10_24 TaxID=3380645 RepID=UPI0038BB16EB
MDIFQMSLSAAVLIIAIVVIRLLSLNKLPKNTFLVLWGVAAFRLLIPYSTASRFSLYNIVDSIAAFFSPHVVMPGVASYFWYDSTPTGTQGDLPIQGGTFTVSPMYMIWIIGAAAVASFFATAFYKSCKELKMAIPIRNNALVDEWCSEHKLLRPIQVLMSDRITTPVAVGILKPRIIFPKTMDFTDKRLMQYVLAHEFQHIKHFDMLWKLVLMLVLCVHWFNPLVWIMYVLANRDLEMACDEKVLTLFGEGTRSEYALSLIGMAEQRSRFTMLYNGFSKNATEERIVSIMKFKKASISTIITAILLAAGVTTVFATAYKDPGTTKAEQGVQTRTVPTTVSMNEAKDESAEEYPPYTLKNRRAFADFAEFLQYDETMHVYRFDGKWVRTLYDENIWKGKSYSGLMRSGITDNPNDIIDRGEPIDLKTVRNPETNQVEKLVEMTEEEAKAAIVQMAPKNQ